MRRGTPLRRSRCAHWEGPCAPRHPAEDSRPAGLCAMPQSCDHRGRLGDSLPHCRRLGRGRRGHAADRLRHGAPEARALSARPAASCAGTGGPPRPPAESATPGARAGAQREAGGPYARCGAGSWGGVDPPPPSPEKRMRRGEEAEQTAGLAATGGWGGDPHPTRPRGSGARPGAKALRRGGATPRCGLLCVSSTEGPRTDRVGPGRAFLVNVAPCANDSQGHVLL